MFRAFALALLFAPTLFAAPVPKALVKPKAPDLTDTHWDLARDGNRGIAKKYHFQEGGVLAHTDRGRHGRGRGTWEVRGGVFTLTMEDGFATYTLTHNDGVLNGTAENRNGLKWPVKLIPLVKK